MNNLPVTVLDLVVLGVVFISALLAAIRGFTREVLAIGSWVAAAVAAYALHPFVVPFLKDYIPNAQLQLAAAIGAVFLGTLIIVSFLTVRLSDLILDSKIGALDRTLGFLFGAARGLLIAVIAFVFFDKLVGEKQQPDWVRYAKLRPVLQTAGENLIALLPDDPEGMIAKWKARKRQDGDPSEPPTAPGPTTPAPATPAPGAPAADPLKKTDRAPAGQPSYSRAGQQNLQQLVETAANPAPRP